jgi:hypothetical protein
MHGGKIGESLLLSRENRIEAFAGFSPEHPSMMLLGSARFLHEMALAYILLLLNAFTFRKEPTHALDKGRTKRKC